MTTRAFGRLARALASPRFATSLIVFAGAWVATGTFVPQGAAADAKVEAWAAAHPVAEALVRLVGLHRAFTSPVLVLAALLLALSTAVCAWQRTRAAANRSRVLRDARRFDRSAVAANHDLEFACDPSLADPEILATVSGMLAALGFRPKVRAREGVVVVASPVASVWGSPVFHWSLVALVCVVGVGGLWRASGLMGLAVGQARVDGPSSYGTGAVTAGPLYRWPARMRVIRVDAFDLNYRTGGVDRGPTPIVTVLDAAGEVLKSQRVYPNHTLRVGSLMIHPADYGLSATVSVVDTNGVELQRATQLIDFSGKVEGGTTPAGAIAIRQFRGASGTGGRFEARVSVPLERVEGGYLGKVPNDPVAHIVVTVPDGGSPITADLRPGQQVRLPGSSRLRLLDVDYYARLKLVDDPSVPLLYLSLTAALLGLALATLGRQGAIAVAVVTDPSGRKLVARVRLWRNMPSTKAELEAKLAEALAEASERSAR